MKDENLNKQETANVDLGAVSGSISSMKETMDSFFREIEEEIKAEPNNLKLIGARWAYRIAMEQFNNRFKKYYH